MDNLLVEDGVQRVAGGICLHLRKPRPQSCPRRRRRSNELSVINRASCVMAGTKDLIYILDWREKVGLMRGVKSVRLY